MYTTSRNRHNAAFFRQRALAPRRYSGNTFAAVSYTHLPTRCSYCSFVSSSVEKTMKLIPAYVELLCQEIAAAGACAGRLGLHLETVYFGGGTPTTLEAGQLNTLLKAVHTHFDLSGCREFTVEAGRPDTITPEKLKALSQNQVTRISINPVSYTHLDVYKRQI